MSFFNSAGIATPTGNGVAPLSWLEIKSWVECSAVEVTPWELSVVRKMSEAYASESARATNPRRRAPYIKPLKEGDIDRDYVDSKVRSIFAGLKKKSK